MASLAFATAPVSTVQAKQPTDGLTPAQAARLAKARDVAQKFEAVFVQQMLELSTPEPDKNNPMSGGFGEEMYRHSLNEQAANAIAKHGGLGLADHIVKQMALRGDVVLPRSQAVQSYQGAAR